MALYNFVH